MLVLTRLMSAGWQRPPCNRQRQRQRQRTASSSREDFTADSTAASSRDSELDTHALAHTLANKARDCRLAEEALRQAQADAADREQQWIAAANSRDSELDYLRQQAKSSGIPDFDRSRHVQPAPGRVSSFLVCLRSGAEPCTPAHNRMSQTCSVRASTHSSCST